MNRHPHPHESVSITGVAVPLYGGHYYIAAVSVPHPTETLEGRTNLVLLNNPRCGMNTSAEQEQVQQQADERAEAIKTAYDAMTELSDQELDWVYQYIKSNVL